MKKVVIMIGCSGAGKSETANELVNEYVKNIRNRSFTDRGRPIIASADNYHPNGAFSKDKLDEAHSKCIQVFIDALLENRHSEHSLIIVDNTNTRVDEFSTYYRVARAYNHEVTFMFVNADIPIETAYSRNKRNTPMETIGAQLDRIRRIHLPPYWKYTRVDIDNFSMERLPNPGLLMFNEIKSDKELQDVILKAIEQGYNRKIKILAFIVGCYDLAYSDQTLSKLIAKNLEPLITKGKVRKYRLDEFDDWKYRLPTPEESYTASLPEPTPVEPPRMVLREFTLEQIDFAETMAKALDKRSKQRGLNPSDKQLRNLLRTIIEDK